MRRLLAIFLLVFLPLQLSWAAVGVYCQHEVGGASQHFAHHEHQHQHKADANHDGLADPKASGDNDCGVCHASCCAVIISEIQLSLPAHPSHIIDHYRNSLYGAPNALPERPNWSLLA